MATLKTTIKTPSVVRTIVRGMGRPGADGQPGANLITTDTETTIVGVLVGDSVTGTMRAANPGEIVSEAELNAALANRVIDTDPRLSDARVPLAHNQDWNTITSTPTTLVGYGITDAQPLNAGLTSVAAIAANGVVARTGTNTFTPRTITGTGNQITVTNGDGVSGNPTLSLPQNIHTAATPTFGAITVNGNVGVRAAATASVPTQILVVTADPTSTTRTVVTRTPAQLRTDIGAGTSSFDGQYSSLSGVPATFPPSAHNQAISTITGLEAELAAKLNANNPAVTNSREWTAETISQAEAEAGTATTRRAFTAQRVRQAIAAWWLTITDVIKSFNTNITGGTNHFSVHGPLGVWDMAKFEFRSHESDNGFGFALILANAEDGIVLQTKGSNVLDPLYSLEVYSGGYGVSEPAAFRAAINLSSTNSPTFAGITLNGPANLRSPSTSSAATQIAVFNADPSATTRELRTRTPSQLRGDIGAVGNSFETVAQSLAALPFAVNYSSDRVSSIVYTLPDTSTITKTINYTGDKVTSIVLSGATPSGIQLTKTITYTGDNITGVSYS